MISIPKCMELNSELILVLGFGLGPHPGSKPNIYFFGGKILIRNQSDLSEIFLDVSIVVVVGVA